MLPLYHIWQKTSVNDIFAIHLNRMTSVLVTIVDLKKQLVDSSVAEWVRDEAIAEGQFTLLCSNLHTPSHAVLAYGLGTAYIHVCICSGRLVDCISGLLHNIGSEPSMASKGMLRGRGSKLETSCTVRGTYLKPAMEVDLPDHFSESNFLQTPFTPN